MDYNCPVCKSNGVIVKAVVEAGFTIYLSPSDSVSIQSHHPILSNNLRFIAPQFFCGVCGWAKPVDTAIVDGATGKSVERLDRYPMYLRNLAIDPTPKMVPHEVARFPCSRHVVIILDYQTGRNRYAFSVYPQEIGGPVTSAPPTHYGGRFPDIEAASSAAAHTILMGT